jgi:hypothetical protein
VAVSSVIILPLLDLLQPYGSTGCSTVYRPRLSQEGVFSGAEIPLLRRPRRRPAGRARSFLAMVLALLLFPAAIHAAPTPGNCTFVADLDFNGGDVAPHILLPGPDETRQARCCALCQGKPGCHTGVLTGPTHTPPHACWFKGGTGGRPKRNADVMSCWNPGQPPVPLPPPPAPPPPPPPQCYKSTLIKLEPKPVISFVDGSSTYPQVFNPSWIEASAGSKAGLIIRTQNCSAKVGGACVHCGGTGPKASVLTFAELLNDDNSSTSGPPRFRKVDTSSLVFGPHSSDDLRGTEDPRVAYDSSTGLYYMFYTCGIHSRPPPTINSVRL